MIYYIKGGSNFDTGAQARVWLGLHRAGFPSGDYSDINWKDFNSSGALNDPYWRLGGNGGQTQTEIGLSGGSRIRITSGGVDGWNVSSGQWETLLGTGAGGASQLSDLTDVRDINYITGNILVADGTNEYFSAPLNHNHLQNIGSTDHHDPSGYETVSGDYNTHKTDVNAHISNLTGITVRNHNDLLNINAGDAYEHITQTQKNDLHTIYSLQVHNNTYHSPNYLANLLEDTTPELAEDLDFNGYDAEVVGTVYHNDSTRYLTRISSNGFDNGTLFNIGLYWNTASNALAVVGYTMLELGVYTDSGIVDITSAGLRVGGVGARVSTIENSDSLGTSDTKLCTQGNVKVYVDKLKEQSITFPASPNEGDRHYDEDDDSEYRYNAEAQAWIEVGVGGGKSILFTPPIGYITMFSGTWVNNSTIPGWYKCDGTNGTVDLVNKFIRGGATAGNEGGSDDAVIVQHNHGGTAQNAGSHTHGMHDADGVTHRTVLDQFSPWSSPSNIVENAMAAAGDHGHTLTINNEGVSGTGKNLPTYYTLIFIQRIN